MLCIFIGPARRCLKAAYRQTDRSKPLHNSDSIRHRDLGEQCMHAPTPVRPPIACIIIITTTFFVEM